MKKSKILFALVIGLAMFSCSDDDDNSMVETQAITEEEAVEIVEKSLAEESAGLEETTYEYAKTYGEEISLNVQCNQPVTDSYMYSYNGTLVQASYDFNWDFTITCNALNVPQSATFNSSGSGTYTTPRIESDDSSTFMATVTGLQPTSSVLTYNATFERVGTQQLTTNQTTRTVTSDFDATLVDLVVGKSDYEVDSGTGTFTLTGSTNQGNFSYNGSIVFNGNQTATLTINGNQYTIDLN
ncbi:hypothetical protein SAMN05192553_1239 [Cyclobacterium xiamenense]|uniref:Lipocalin-like domain-containing protein n=1 Tax=Cyclobacterium xiamenense TaxID=1297121 RepID=A0A1H7C078_9BACT|nr:hypothetical protein [Cyclobacterium xiamenense]SEJ83111.1 hypothetical protein SAMN05192553_1239 [Cyclobacterium xiamenense]